MATTAQGNASPATTLRITPETRIGEILTAYGDIAEVMESFGVKRVGKFNIRRLIGTVLTVRWAAKIHGMPLDKFVEVLQRAIARHEEAASEAAMQAESNS